eukprot:3240909-Pleurochrysis_carterae.AAC.2
MKASLCASIAYEQLARSRQSAHLFDSDAEHALELCGFFVLAQERLLRRECFSRGGRRRNTQLKSARLDGAQLEQNRLARALRAARSRS